MTFRVRAILGLLIACPMTSPAQEEPVVPSKIEVRVADPASRAGKDPIVLRPGEVAKVAIEVGQSRMVVRPDTVAIVFETKGASSKKYPVRMDEDFTTSGNKAFIRGVGTLTVPEIGEGCRMVVIATYAVTSRTRTGRLELVPVRSKPYQVRKP